MTRRSLLQHSGLAVSIMAVPGGWSWSQCITANHCMARRLPQVDLLMGGRRVVRLDAWQQQMLQRRTAAQETEHA